MSNLESTGSPPSRGREARASNHFTIHEENVGNHGTLKESRQVSQVSNTRRAACKA